MPPLPRSHSQEWACQLRSWHYCLNAWLHFRPGLRLLTLERFANRFRERDSWFKTLGFRKLMLCLYQVPDMCTGASWFHIDMATLQVVVVSNVLQYCMYDLRCTDPLAIVAWLDYQVLFSLSSCHDKRRNHDIEHADRIGAHSRLHRKD